MEKICVYGATKNKYWDMFVSVTSCLKNGNVDRIILLIEDDEFPYHFHDDRIRCINVTHLKWGYTSSPCFGSLWTWMVLVRSEYHNFLPCDRCLSIDIDTIVMDDLTELFETDLTNYYIAAVPEVRTEPSMRYYPQPYINCGVMLMNLEMLRDGTGDAIHDDLMNKPSLYPEQDRFNDFCYPNIKLLDSRYNETIFTGESTSPAIIHYAGSHKSALGRRSEWNRYEGICKTIL